mgnify:CR=1 FL=1
MQKIVIQKLSVREAEQMATKLVLNKTQVGSTKKAKIKSDPDLRQLKERLSDQLNLAVEIKQKRFLFFLTDFIEDLYFKMSIST